MDLFCPTTPKEVMEIIKKKAPGRDGVTSMMLKNLGRKGKVARPGTGILPRKRKEMEVLI